MEIIQEEVAPKGVKKRRFTLFRASLVCFVVFTLLCGLAYPLSVTLAAQTAFPTRQTALRSSSLCRTALKPSMAAS